MVQNKTQNKIIVLLLGALCFFVSQILLRIPLLNSLSSNFSLGFIMNHTVLISLVALLSAGLFEEGFRFIFRAVILRDVSEEEKGMIAFENKFSDAIVFGLGHGLCEVAYILTVSLFSSAAFINLHHTLLFLLERLLAVTFHISLAIIVFRGFKIDKKFSYLVLAIGLHTLYNAPILFSQAIGLAGVYALMFVMNIILIIFISLTRLKVKGEE